MIPRSSITRPAGPPRSTRAGPPAGCVAVRTLAESAVTIFAFSVSFPDRSFTLINDSETISRATSEVDVNQIVLSESLHPVEQSRGNRRSCGLASLRRCLRLRCSSVTYRFRYSLSFRQSGSDPLAGGPLFTQRRHPNMRDRNLTTNPTTSDSFARTQKTERSKQL